MGKRLKVGEAITRWRAGDGAELRGRVSFQLEKVYNTKGGRTYGPYGPYWYVYYWTGDNTPSPGARPKGGRTAMRSRYLGKPDAVDPHTISAGELGKLLKERAWSPAPFVDEELRHPPAAPGATAITLVACSAKKLALPAPAASMYTSDWFRKARAWAQRREDEYGDLWFIMSAKYGLLDPDEEIEPYDVTLNKMPIEARKLWANRVLRAVTNLTSETEEVERGATITILGGTRYTDLLAPALHRAGYFVELPLQGMAIGKQLAWLKHPASWRRTGA